MGKRLNTEEFIRRAQEVHGDRYDYGKTEYVNARTKVVVKCMACTREFEQCPRLHLTAKACALCYGTKKMNTEPWVKRAKEAHGDKYDYSKTQYVDSRTKVSVTCNQCLKEFKQMPSPHLSGSGCNSCVRKLDGGDWVKRAQEVHGSTYDYSKTEYKERRKKVIIICRKHGPFSQWPHTHLNGGGCLKCFTDKSRLSNDDFIESAEKAHGAKFDYTRSVYKGTHEPVEIGCRSCGGFFESLAGNHMRGSGCPLCCRKSTTEEFIAKALEVHGDTYSYEKVVYEGSNDHVSITCSKHGVFKQRPGGHLQGYGCKKCGLYSYISTGEENWLNSLEVPERQHTIKLSSGRRAVVDGYDPATNTVYEFLGDFWHGNPDVFDQEKTNPIRGKTFGFLLEETMSRISAVEADGYAVVYIWEADWNEANQ